MPLKTHQDDQPTLNLTPMIDIVFLLIIFFMVGTKFAEMENNIKLEVPRVTEAGTLTAAPDKKVINVFENGKIVMDNQELNVDELGSTLRQAVGQYSDLGVVIRSSDSVEGLDHPDNRSKQAQQRRDSRNPIEQSKVASQAIRNSLSGIEHGLLDFHRRTIPFF